VALSFCEARDEQRIRRDAHVEDADEPSALRRSLDVYEACIGGAS